MEKHSIDVIVNGDDYTLEVPARRLLADFLRDDLGLTGTKRGCETGICGACTVSVDGKAVKSCIMLAIQARDKQVLTIEGLSDRDGKLHPLQQSFIERGGLQCGFCTPGFIMTAYVFLAQVPSPREEDIRAALTGNLCRCTGYVGIVESILAAAEKMSGS
ncbi:MAG TPA: (2Fe-2S)-binding protein [Stellaceae bacterium]|nr:(2Fe-2S)-binding protein [Stellaceae bacterium]